MAQTARELFTPTEAAAITGVPVKLVRKEIEKKVIKATRKYRRARSDVHVTLEDLLYLRVLGGLDITLPARVRGRIHDEISAQYREHSDASEVVLSGAIVLRVREARDSVLKRLEQLRKWQESLVSDPDILGGETVFPHSRLSVRRIGTALERGESRAAVKEDYPYLNDDDLEFAQLYVRAYPNVGRPKADQAAA
jgi:uncharacterized protein (DUF433 family)